MKANELMIGDCVRHKRTKEVISIFEIDDDRNVINNEPDGYCSEKNIDIDDVEPIPLTPEILEKNGFTTYFSRCGVKWLWIEKQKFELALDEENGNKITTALGLIDIEIKYVHQLQHALRLCGIEKTIEL